MKFETKAIRIQTERSQHREHGTPIFPTSSFVFNDAEQMRSLFAGEETGNIYSRFTNPSVREFELKIAALEEVDDAFATSTGMAAVFAVFMTFLKKGEPNERTSLPFYLDLCMFHLKVRIGYQK